MCGLETVALTRSQEAKLDVDLGQFGHGHRRFVDVVKEDMQRIVMREENAKKGRDGGRRFVVVTPQGSS